MRCMSGLPHDFARRSVRPSWVQTRHAGISSPLRSGTSLLTDRPNLLLHAGEDSERCHAVILVLRLAN